MNQEITSDSGPAGAPDAVDPQRKMEALRRLIRRSAGHFSLVLIEYDLPRQRKAVLEYIHEAFARPEFNVVEVTLEPPAADESGSYNVLDQLQRRVQAAALAAQEVTPTIPSTVSKPPDVLIVLGYETLLLADPAAVDPSLQRIQSEHIEPFTLGRNLLVERYPCPLLMFLPANAMGALLRSAPDFTSWRSAFYQFQTDPAEICAELDAAAQKGMAFFSLLWASLRDPEELDRRTAALKSLIEDAIRFDDKNEAGRLVDLYEQLGALYLARGKGDEARWAFSQMARLVQHKSAHWRHLVRHKQRLMKLRFDFALWAVSRLPFDIKMNIAGLDLSPQKWQMFSRVVAALARPEEQAKPGLFGREDERRRLLKRVLGGMTRFVIVWGETGSGKSLFVHEGLLPDLKDEPHYKPILIDKWDTDYIKSHSTEAYVCRRIERELGLTASEQTDSLYECLQRVTRQTEDTLIIICDQFEQFVRTHRRRAERAPLFQAIGKCVDDKNIPCRFMFLVREEDLGLLAEFDDYVQEPLERNKRFYLPPFSDLAAFDVLKQLNDSAKLGWPLDFVNRIITDLLEDGRVPPVHLRLVVEALAAAGVVNENQYTLVGGASRLLSEYINVILDVSYDPASLYTGITSSRLLNFFIKPWYDANRRRFTFFDFGISNFFLSKMENQARKLYVEQAKTVLLAFVGEDDTGETLSAAQIAARTRQRPALVHSLLAGLITRAKLVKEVSYASLEAPPSESQPAFAAPDAIHYELRHDYLVGYIKDATRNLQDKRRQNNDELRLALIKLDDQPRFSLSLLKLWRIHCYSDADALKEPPWRKLWQRSLVMGVLKLAVMVCLLLLCLAVVQRSAVYVSIDEQRVVIKRGLPYLRYSFMGNEEILLDTGLHYQDFNPNALQALKDRPIWPGFNDVLLSPWRRQTFTVGNAELFCQQQGKQAPLNDLKRGLLLCQLYRNPDRGNNGSAPQSELQTQGIQILLDELNTTDPQAGFSATRRVSIVNTLEMVARVDPDMASRILDALIRKLKDARNYPIARQSAAEAVGEIGSLPGVAKDELAGRAFQALLETAHSTQTLQNSTSGQDDIPTVRAAAYIALGRLAAANPKAHMADAEKELLNALKKFDDLNYAIISSAAAKGIGYVAQAENSNGSRNLIRNILEVRTAYRAYLHSFDIDYTYDQFILSLYQPKEIILNFRDIPFSYSIPSGPPSRRSKSHAASNDGVSTDDVRAAIAESLGYVGKTNSQAAAAAFPTLKEFVSHSEKYPTTHTRALTALGYISAADFKRYSKDTFNKVREVIEGDGTEPQIHRAAVRVLKYWIDRKPQYIVTNPIGNPAVSLDLLYEALTYRKHIKMHGVAAEALADIYSIGFSSPQETLTQLKYMLKDPNEEERYAAVIALGAFARQYSLGGTKTEDTYKQLHDELIACLEDDAPQVQQAAARMIGLIADVYADEKYGIYKKTAFITREDAVRQQEAYRLLSRSDEEIRAGVQEPLSDIVLHRLLARLSKQNQNNSNEQKDMFWKLLRGEEPLLDDLPSENANDVNTLAGYHHIAVDAFARWIVSVKGSDEAVYTRVKRELQESRRTEKDMRIHVAAWEVLAEVSRLEAEAVKQAAFTDTDDNSDE